MVPVLGSSISPIDPSSQRTTCVKKIIHYICLLIPLDLLRLDVSCFSPLKHDEHLLIEVFLAQ